MKHQKFQMDDISNQTKPTLNLLKNSQNKFNLDETFTEASDLFSLKTYLIIPNQNHYEQTKPNHTKPTLNLLWNSQNKLELDETFKEASDGCTSSNQT